MTEQIHDNLSTSSVMDDGSAQLTEEPAGVHKPIPPKLYRIGEVVEYSGLSRQTIHNYTIMGLLQESRWTRGGHRLYDESVFRRLDKIAELRAGKKSIEDIGEYLRRHQQD